MTILFATNWFKLQLFVFGWIVASIIRIRPNTTHPLFGTALIETAKNPAPEFPKVILGHSIKNTANQLPCASAFMYMDILPQVWSLRWPVEIWMKVNTEIICWQIIPLTIGGTHLISKRICSDWLCWIPWQSNRHAESSPSVLCLLLLTNTLLTQLYTVTDRWRWNKT